ncbi:MAG: hypothetical protein HC923_04395 [Myxococcales bacterium]|nr:hypothetical protein [Myxococcales bacterium]
MAPAFFFTAFFVAPFLAAGALLRAVFDALAFDLFPDPGGRPRRFGWAKDWDTPNR